MTKKQSPYKHADGSACWTKNCRLGNKSTSNAKDSFKAEWFPTVKSEPLTPNQIIETLKLKLIRPSNLDYDSIKNELGWIEDWEHPWTEAEKKNLSIVKKIGTLTQKDPFTDEDKAAVDNLIQSMEPAVTPQNRTGRWSSNDPDADNWRARDKMLHSLAKDLLIRRQADDLTYEPANELAGNERLIGLQEAQEFALQNLNYPSYQKDGLSYMGDVEPHYQEAIARVVRGDEAINLPKDEGDRSLLPESQRIFTALHPDSAGSLPQSQLYLAAVFPVKELKQEMERANIDNISVTPFQNGREWGNVYTTITPTGETRSFSVYEHRNTDSIVINGIKNWDGKELPYAGEKSGHFFAEFAPEDKKRAAQALTFYLMESQHGTLNEDTELVQNATRRDWNSILDNSIPGFKEWRQSKITDTYIAPEDETEEDILGRLDF